MIKKKIFQKELFNNNIKKYFILLILFLFLSFFLYFIFLMDDEYFTIPPFNGLFYIIPKDKGGQIIPYQNKKGLHLSFKDNNEIDFINNPKLEYSIQVKTNDNFFVIKNFREDLLNMNDSIYLSNELYIAILQNNLGSEYFLLYKNFPSRLKALEHCEKFAYFLEKCVIVNVQNLY